MSEIEKEIPLPLDEQVSMELVKHNYTEAKLQEFEEYLKLDIVDDDKEAYLLIKDKRKEVKSYRVAVEKFCKFKREDAVKIQKAWVSKENELVEKISKVEDYLESKEKAYEKKIAEEKEARKRKQEEQLILRQQKLTAMGALYSDGNFVLGDVSFEFSAIKESEEDIWNETIYPRFHEEYLKIQAEELLKEQQRKEAEAELKRQQEEMERKRKELEEKEAGLKREAERQAAEAQYKKDAQIKARQYQITTLGFRDNGTTGYVFRDFVLLEEDIRSLGDEDWGGLIARATEYVEVTLKDEAEQKRKEQERKELQDKRYAELRPYEQYGYKAEMNALWCLTEDQYAAILTEKKQAFNLAEEEKAKEIAEKAAKAERERIEEEQRQAEAKRKKDLRDSRISALEPYDADGLHFSVDLSEMSEELWVKLFTEAKESHERLIRAQEEERKAEELAQAGDKEKWKDIMDKLNAIDVHSMRSSQYRKKAAILREKLEEIKAL